MNGGHEGGGVVLHECSFSGRSCLMNVLHLSNVICKNNVILAVDRRDDLLFPV